MDHGERAGRLACQMMRCSPADLMFDRGPSMHASCSRGASLCRQAATSTRLLTASPSLITRPPPCTRSYLGSCSSGNSELARPSRAADDACVRSVCAGVPDSQGPSPWTRLAGRVWFAAVWPQSMHSGASPRLYGKPVWWAPRHGSVAGSGQVRVCAAGIGPLESGLVSLKRMQRRRGGALAPLRTSTIRPKTRGRAAGRLSRARPV